LFRGFVSPRAVEKIYTYSSSNSSSNNVWENITKEEYLEKYKPNKEKNQQRELRKHVVEPHEKITLEEFYKRVCDLEDYSLEEIEKTVDREIKRKSSYSDKIYAFMDIFIVYASYTVLRRLAKLAVEPSNKETTSMNRNNRDNKDNKVMLKAELRKLGVLIKGNMVRKKDILKVLADYLVDMPTVHKMIKQEIGTVWKEIVSQYDLSSKGVKEIEYKSRDGFFSGTQGGFEARGFATIDMLHLDTPQNEKAEKAILDSYDDNLKYARDGFWKDHKSELERKGLTEEDIDVDTLREKGFEELAEKLYDYVDDQNTGDENSVMFQIGVYYYEPNKGEDEHQVYVFSEINWEAPYFRSGKGASVVPFEKDIYFKGAADLRPELLKALRDAAIAISQTGSLKENKGGKNKKLAPVQRLTNYKRF